jgi:rubredoxin/uncharacterized membrane protein
MRKWQCTVCGYIHEGETAPEKCPVCGADKSLFVPYQEEAGVAPAAPVEAQAAGGASASQWRCTVCGYLHTGSAPPEKCPVCGADKSLFVPVSGDLQATSAPGGDAPADPEEEFGSQPDAPSSAFKPPWEGNARLSTIAQTLTRLHGHPIAVHIPNGVLPVTVLFGLLALLFRSQSMATAAGYNMVLVCLAMPIVIATGLVDWVNRFGGHMTAIFKNKMICAGVVTVLSLVLAIWWLAAPEVYQRGLFANWFFVLLHLIDLGVAGLAGWYGGKLVFKA